MCPSFHSEVFWVVKGCRGFSSIIKNCMLYLHFFRENRNLIVVKAYWFKVVEYKNAATYFCNAKALFCQSDWLSSVTFDPSLMPYVVKFSDKIVCWGKPTACFQTGYRTPLGWPHPAHRNDAKLAKICNLWTFCLVIQLINHLFIIQQTAFWPNAQ